MKKLLTGGLVYQEHGFEKLDMYIEDSEIKILGEHVFVPYVEVIDCQGMYILPGIVDMHVHVGEKICGLDLADNFQSLAALADKCGIAAIGSFITERYAPDEIKTLTHQFEQMSEKADKEFPHPVRWHLTPTVSEPEDILPLFRQGCDLKFYTTYKPNGLYRSYDDIARWMKDLVNIKPRMLVHCEDDEIVTATSAFNPFKHPFDHTKRRPELAEIKAVEKVLDLAVKYNYPVHIVHVSTPGAAMLINEAREHAPVSCETAPHYLLLNDDKLKAENGHRWICTPPFRNEHSRGLMVELLQEGIFDAIATDHCPFTKADKDKNKANPELVPTGIAGLGATFPILYENLVKTGKLSLEKLMLYISTNPAKLMNLYPDYGTIRTGTKTELLTLQQKPADKSVPILSSLSDSPNTWESYKTKITLNRI